jgi:hypothetical protein
MEVEKNSILETTHTKEIMQQAYRGTINIYKFHRKGNNCLLTYVTLHVSTPKGSSSGAESFHIQLLNCNAKFLFTYVWSKKVTFYVHSILSTRY